MSPRCFEPPLCCCFSTRAPAIRSECAATTADPDGAPPPVLAEVAAATHRLRTLPVRRCNAQWEMEEVCDDSADTDGSCEDACCKVHDTCCGHKTPSTGKADCNTAIVTCLDACSGDNVSKWCRDSLDIPISSRVIADAMDLVEGWCCGGPCPKRGGDGTPHVALTALASNRSGSLLVEELRPKASVEAVQSQSR